MNLMNEDFDPLDQEIEPMNTTWSLPGESARDTLLRAVAKRHMVRLDSDVARIFPDAKSVNTANSRNLSLDIKPRNDDDPKPPPFAG
ncbi:hypothetical protein BH11ARM2_BH11ARM2_22370 [soil metagenome]